MLDFNHRPSTAERINALVDAALIAEREATPPRTYLGASRLGHACERALQFEFAGAPKDEGADFGGQTLGSLQSATSSRIWRSVGCARLGSIWSPKSGMAASLASPSRAVASGAMLTGSSLMLRRRLACACPRCGNARP